MAQNTADTQTSQQTTNSNPALERLSALVGEWTIDVVLPAEPDHPIHGRATLEWMEGGFFLIQRSEMERPEFPKTFSIIGADDMTEGYSMLYSDSRGVARLYQMSLHDGFWKLWRDAPGFSQRFVGCFSKDGTSLKAYWEKSDDGLVWEHDFDMTYTKVKP